MSSDLDRSNQRWFRGDGMHASDGESIVAFVFDQALSQPPETVTLSTGVASDFGGRVRASWSGSSVLVNWDVNRSRSRSWVASRKGWTRTEQVLDDKARPIGVREHSEGG